MSDICSGGGGTTHWDYLPLAMPAGSAEALWQFDKTANSLVDRTGNGHTLTQSGVQGAVYYTYSAEGLMGLGFVGYEYYTAALPTNLRILGALTVELQCLLYSQLPQQQHALVYCGGSDETLAHNVLYRLAGISSTPNLQYHCEYGAGTNVLVLLNSTPVAGRITLLTLTRTVAGAVSLYMDGQRVFGPTAAHVPEGGTSASFLLGHDLASGQYFEGIMFSCRVSAQELSSAQVLAVYEDIGPVQ